MKREETQFFFFWSLNYVVPFVPLTWCCGDMSNYWYSIDSPVAQSPLLGSIWFLWNHGITEWFRLKGTLEILQFQPPNSSSNILCSLRETKVLVLWGTNLCSKNPNQPKISISSGPHPKGWAGQGFSPMRGGKEEGSCKQVDWSGAVLLSPNGGSAEEDSPNYRNPDCFMPAFLLIVHL